jgi:hypothetical protein
MKALSAIIAAAAIALAAEKTQTELVVTPVIVAGAVVAVVAVIVPVSTLLPFVGITVPGTMTGVPLIGVPYTATAPGVPGTAATGPADCARQTDVPSKRAKIIRTKFFIVILLKQPFWIQYQIS